MNLFNSARKKERLKLIFALLILPILIGVFSIFYFFSGYDKVETTRAKKMGVDVFFIPIECNFAFKVRDPYRDTIRSALVNLDSRKDMAQPKPSVPWGYFVSGDYLEGYRAGKISVFDRDRQKLAYVAIPELADFDKRVTQQEALLNGMKDPIVWSQMMNGIADIVDINAVRDGGK